MALNPTEQFLINEAIRIYVEVQDSSPSPSQWPWIRKKEKPAVLIDIKEHSLLLNGDDCRAICRELRIVSQQLKDSEALPTIEDFWKIVKDVVVKQIEYRKVFSAIWNVSNRNREKLIRRLK